MDLTYISYYAGGDLAGIGLQAAGYVPDTLVEYDPAIAEVAATNHPSARVLVADVTTLDPRRFARPGLFWASPECKEFSQGKVGGMEGPLQIAQAEAICAFLRVVRPPTFVLENVVRYRASASLAKIRATLSALGYLDDMAVLCAADFGVPQSRHRLILRACLGSLVPHLPAPVPWQGWYGAIADLIPTLPESRFAAWQLARLDRLAEHTLVNQRYDKPQGSEGRKPQPAGACAPAMTITVSDGDRAIRAFLVGGGNTQLAQVDSWPREGDQPAFTVPAGNGGTSNMRALLVSGLNAGQEWGKGYKDATEPAMTVTSEMHRGAPRALLVSGQSSNGGPPSLVGGDDPAFTVGTNADRCRAFIVATNGERGDLCRDAAEPCQTIVATSSAGKHRAWLDEGRVVKMTIRALARFQSVPDSYRLPDKQSLGSLVVGNGVPCRLAQAIGAGLAGIVGAA